MEIWIKAIIGGMVYYLILWWAADEPGIVTVPSMKFSIFLSICFLFTNLWWQLLITYWTVFVIMPIIAKIKKTSYREKKEQEKESRRKEEERRIKEERARMGEEKWLEMKREEMRKRYDETIDYLTRESFQRSRDLDKAEEYRKKLIAVYEKEYAYINYKYRGEAACKDELNETNI